jgi:two-component system, chemotaxis family, protein-glutamate methylesterase/glutaminase
MSIVKLTIATSSASELHRLRAAIGNDPDMRVIAHCPGLMETFNAVEHAPPDVVLIARDLTLLPEFELMRLLFETLDVRWLVIDPSGPSANVAGLRRPDEAIAALAQGQADLFTLRAGASPAGLILQIRSVTRAARRAAQIERPAERPVRRNSGRLVLIGASTGGVDALATVLSAFPADCPPTVIVQHTGKGFGAGLVQLLSLRCPARVVACRDGLELTEGMVCVAAGTPGHATFSGFGPLRMTVNMGDSVSGHMPSIDQMFLSAVPAGRRVVAALLTGMGSDGAAGLLALRKAGATTMSQDAATSVVYGMPRVAWENGGAERQLPLNRIGPALLQQSRAVA